MDGAVMRVWQSQCFEMWRENTTKKIWSDVSDTARDSKALSQFIKGEVL